MGAVVGVAMLQPERVTDLVQEGGVGVAALGRGVVADVAKPHVAVAREWAGIIGMRGRGCGRTGEADLRARCIGAGLFDKGQLAVFRHHAERRARDGLLGRRQSLKAIGWRGVAKIEAVAAAIGREAIGDGQRRPRCSRQQAIDILAGEIAAGSDGGGVGGIGGEQRCGCHCWSCDADRHTGAGRSIDRGAQEPLDAVALGRAGAGYATTESHWASP